MNIDRLAQDVVNLLRENKLRIAFAESCTGGMISAAITSVSGVSDVLDLSVVTYANSAKTEYTDVTEDVLNSHGAVSEQAATLMASGIRKRAKACIGVGITGIAGPDGGSAEKPVGTVYIAVDSDEKTAVRKSVFDGDRGAVRLRATEQALMMLLDFIRIPEV